MSKITSVKDKKRLNVWQTLALSVLIPMTIRKSLADLTLVDLPSVSKENQVTDIIADKHNFLSNLNRE
jgi:hypothetical protein